MATVGRPSKYRPEFAAQAKALCKLGATDPELAEFFKVSVRTVEMWRVQHKEFLRSVKLGKKEADDRVEQSLFKRATGFEHDDVDLRVVDNRLVKTKIRKVYPPETAACIFWLKNRRKAEWRDRIDNTLSAPDGGPVQFTRIERVVVPAPKRDA